MKISKEYLNESDSDTEYSEYLDDWNELFNHVEKPKIINYCDLFCGLGAFHKAFDLLTNKDIKYSCVFACDIDEGIQKLYQENYNIFPHGDINKIDLDTLPNIDILCAGFPCQSFSIAGKQDGFNNKDKGNLFFSVLKVIDKKKPNTIILENVKNLTSINNGETFKTIINELEKRGYKVSHSIINSKYYNCAQSRQRVFIVCQKNKKYQFPNIKNKIIPVSSILDNSVTDYFDYNKKYFLEENKNQNDLENDSDDENNGCKMVYKLINKETKKGGRQGERIYSINSCGPTICASSGGPGAKTGFYLVDNILKKIRTLSVKESLKMFNFNEDYKRTTVPNDNDMLFYLGNSIIVNVVYEIIKKLDI
jgi:DNA (cytosine-5)-methyltransferase 1